MNSLNTKFRSAISHALLGADCEASRETWELVFSECEKITKKYHQSRLQAIAQEVQDLYFRSMWDDDVEIKLVEMQDVLEIITKHIDP